MIRFKNSEQFVSNIFDQFSEIDFCASFHLKNEAFFHKESRDPQIPESKLLEFCIKNAEGNLDDDNFALDVMWESGSFLTMKRISDNLYLVISCSQAILPFVNLYFRNIVYEPEPESTEIELKEETVSNQEDLRAAQRIQSLILSDPNQLRSYFKEHELIYRPFNIIGGDFYFFIEYQESIFIVLGDCTGHGVEGALASMTVSSIIKGQLNNVEVDLYKAATNINDQISNYNLSNNQSDNGYGLGAEFAIIKYNKENSLMCGISSGITIGKLNEKEVLYCKPRNGFGHEFSFESFNWQLNKGDLVMLYSDGVPDQFDANNKKKLGRKKALELVKSVYSEGSLGGSFEDSWQHWKGNTEQIDDVTFIGMVV